MLLVWNLVGCRVLVQLFIGIWGLCWNQYNTEIPHATPNKNQTLYYGPPYTTDGKSNYILKPSYLFLFLLANKQLCNDCRSIDTFEP